MPDARTWRRRKQGHVCAWARVRLSRIARVLLKLSAVTWKGAQGRSLPPSPCLVLTKSPPERSFCSKKSFGNVSSGPLRSRLLSYSTQACSGTRVPGAGLGTGRRRDEGSDPARGVLQAPGDATHDGQRQRVRHESQQFWEGEPCGRGGHLKPRLGGRAGGQGEAQGRLWARVSPKL